jgi:hypothetical protein
MVTHQLTRAGADLEKPRHVIFHLYAPTLDVAQSIAKDAGGTGHGSRAQAGKSSPKYPDSRPVTCETNAAIPLDFVRETGDLFDTPAAGHHAEHDGREAATTPCGWSLSRSPRDAEGHSRSLGSGL